MLITTKQCVVYTNFSDIITAGLLICHTTLISITIVRCLVVKYTCETSHIVVSKATHNKQHVI